MADPLQTTVSELPDSRVRVQVQVAPEQVDAGLQRTARRVGRQLKLPGFRRGKVPPPIVIQRLGREAVLDEAVRDALPGWYAEAIRVARIVPVGDPSIDLGELPGQGAPLEFSIEIGVLPKAKLGEYSGLEVGRGESEVSEEQIEEEIAGMRERLARLEAVERTATEGDYVVVDYVGRLPSAAEDAGAGEGVSGGENAEAPVAAKQTTLVPFAGGEGRDQLIELGGGNLIPGFEEGLLGASAGETRMVDVTFPADYGNAELAGREASFEIDVKEVKAKELPDLDEDFAIDAGFDDVQELREDVAKRLGEAIEQQVREEFREAVLDAVVAGAEVPVTDDLAQARAREMWERTLHSLSHRGISREAYLQISGRGEEEILAEMQPEAERALRREAVLTAIVAAEGIEPSEQDMLEAVRPTAERENVTPEQVLERLRAADRIDELSEDLAARQALELIVERAVPISLEQARAREKLWTPGKDEGGEAGSSSTQGAGEDKAEHERLWTPAS
jgi:trigger factor